MSVEELYPWMSAEDSIREKNWAAGSLKPSDNLAYIFTLREGSDPACTSMIERYLVEPQKLVYSQMLIKIVDETLVNASDHMIRCTGDKYPVTQISMTFDRSGRICVTNNGRGFAVVEHKQATAMLKHPVYLPEMFLGCAFQGSNRKKDADSIIGGTNGLGGKITNIHSHEFVVDTVDPDRQLHYRQRWQNGMRICHPPVITPCVQMPRDKAQPHTTIEFVPNYESMGWKLTDGKLSEADFAMLVNILRTRMVHTAAYCHYGARPKKGGLSIWFNNELLRFYSAQDILQCMFPSCNVYSGMTTGGKQTWDVAICATAAPSIAELSIVNGIVVGAGKHITALTDELANACDDKFKKLSETEQKHARKFMRDNMFLLVNSKIGDPEWQSQSKDVLVGNIKLFRPYKLPTKLISQFLADIAEHRDEALGTTKAKKTRAVTYDKYTPAELAGTSRASECMLLVFEGDSAMNGSRGGIAKNKLNSTIGMICSGGVPPNARRDSTVMQTAAGQYVKMSDMLANNKFFEALLHVCGLNTSYRYDPATGPQYKKEMKQLRYGCLVAMVDQDLDGKGNILGSLLSTFHHWWPNLLKAGFVKWASTPIIRAYPLTRGSILSFETQIEYEEWAKRNDTSRYHIKYYKGLGGHDSNEMAHMFSQFKKQLYTFTCDDAAAKSFHIYYGDESQERKNVLVTPARVLTSSEHQTQLTTRTIPVSTHLHVETKAYQLDNLERKLDHAIDGLNQSGRKIVDGMIKAFRDTKVPKKVAVLAGFISEKCNYHHGEASLCDSITRRGFLCAGGAVIPDPVPFGQFGTIIKGGKDASASRYIFGGPNPIKPMLFRPEHYDLLPFTVEEGSTYEPDYFTPIVPMAICEGSHMPAHGWKIDTYPRDMDAVIANVRLMIKVPDARPRYMPPCTWKGAPYEWKGSIRMVGSIEYSVGKYHATNHQSIRITALPFLTWVGPYIKRMTELAAEDPSVIEEIINSSGDNTCDITIQLRPGAYATLNQYATTHFDGVEEYFKLRDSMSPQINFMYNDAVVSLQAYEEVFKLWFPRVRQMYIDSQERQIILAELHVEMYSSICRYIRERLQLGTKTLKEMTEILTKGQYPKFNKAHLSTPGTIPNAQLRTYVTSTDATYMYLLQMSDFKKSNEHLEKYQEKLEKYKLRLETLIRESKIGEFSGAYQWLKDLDEFEATYHEGMRTAWKFGQTDMKFA